MYTEAVASFIVPLGLVALRMRKREAYKLTLFNDHAIFQLHILGLSH